MPRAASLARPTLVALHAEDELAPRPCAIPAHLHQARRGFTSQLAVHCTRFAHCDLCRNYYHAQGPTRRGWVPHAHTVTTETCHAPQRYQLIPRARLRSSTITENHSEKGHCTTLLRCANTAPLRCFSWAYSNITHRCILSAPGELPDLSIELPTQRHVLRR